MERGGNQQSVIRGLSFVLVIICAGSSIFGCSREFDNPFDPDSSSYEAVYLKEGWQAYQAGEIQKAKEKFVSALSLDDSYAKAYNGLGWCEFRLGNLSEAGEAFSSAIENDTTLLDAHVGFAGKSLAVGEYKSVVEHATIVLNSSSNYVFSHDPSITYYQVRLMLAEAYFQIGEYKKAFEQVSLLNPDNKIIPESESFIEDLAQEIETL